MSRLPVSDSIFESAEVETAPETPAVTEDVDPEPGSEYYFPVDALEIARKAALLLGPRTLECCFVELTYLPPIAAGL